ncbi:hypothetical protein BH11PLA2_BH11PLA2_47300 [soil metagenome]
MGGRTMKLRGGDFFDKLNCNNRNTILDIWTDLNNTVAYR